MYPPGVGGKTDWEGAKRCEMLDGGHAEEGSFESGGGDVVCGRAEYIV